MLDALSKSFFHALAGSRTIKSLASRYGMRRPSSFGRRFIAGETIAEAIPAARELASRGMLLTLDLLGESVDSLDAAAAAARAYTGVVDAVVQAGIERNVSLKLTQLGLALDKAHAIDNLRRILSLAQKHDFFVRIDMEDSPYTEVTLEILETVWRLGHANCGTVLQSCLRRSERDLARVNALGARVRLVKGAYQEPRDVAFQVKAEVDDMFARMMKTLLLEGTYPAIATHDTKMIDLAKRIATEHRIPRDRFEFQMLYGIRRDLQASLVAEGYRMRVYVPFGREWFPYFMRRLGERPANVGFVLRGLMADRG